MSNYEIPADTIAALRNFILADDTAQKLATQHDNEDDFAAALTGEIRRIAEHAAEQTARGFDYLLDRVQPDAYRMRQDVDTLAGVIHARITVKEVAA